MQILIYNLRPEREEGGQRGKFDTSDIILLPSPTTLKLNYVLFIRLHIQNIGLIFINE